MRLLSVSADVGLSVDDHRPLVYADEVPQLGPALPLS